MKRIEFFEGKWELWIDDHFITAFNTLHELEDYLDGFDVQFKQQTNNLAIAVALVITLATLAAAAIW